MDLIQILAYLLSILGIIGAVYITKYYKYSGKIKSILKEMGDIIVTIDEDLKDGTFTKEEVEQLINEINELYYVVFPKGIDE